MVVIAVHAIRFMAVVFPSNEYQRNVLTVIIYSITLKYLCLVKHTFLSVLSVHASSGRIIKYAAAAAAAGSAVIVGRSVP